MQKVTLMGLGGEEVTVVRDEVSSMFLGGSYSSLAYLSSCAELTSGVQRWKKLRCCVTWRS